MSKNPILKVIRQNRLFVSEPNPMWFGNGANAENDPAWTNPNWLKSRFHFSFAEYNNYNNLDYGVLRVMNDDLVQPHRGFGTHPHSNMEIITYIVEGELTHQDSIGTKESLGRGSIQFMSAGSGIRHSEFNHGDKPLRFIQTWIKPAQMGIPPNYGGYAADHDLKKNKLHHLVSNVQDPSTSTPVEIMQDCNTYASELEKGQKVSMTLRKNRMLYLLCVEGSVRINGSETLSRHDACEVQGSATEDSFLEIEAVEVEPTEHGDLAHVLMFEMALNPSAGRKDI